MTLADARVFCFVMPVEDDLPVETVHDDRQVAFEVRNGELGYIGQPQPVRVFRAGGATCGPP